MKDPIERQDAIDAVKEALYDSHYTFCAVEALNDLPSAKPKYGKWIQKYPKASWVECSECGETCLGGLRSGKLFCSNCGADMRGDHE